HAMGYIGWRDYSTYQLPANYASPFDVRVQVSAGVPYFTGPRVQSLYGAPAPLTAGNVFHWGNSAPTPGSDLIGQLMNGVVFYRGAKYDLSTLDAALLSDIGIPVDSISPSVTAVASNFDAIPS